MVQVGNAATAKEKEVKTRYPVEEGLTAGTTTQTGNETTLEAQDFSQIPSRLKRGIQSY